MTEAPAAASGPETPFSYVCRRCNSCCRNKRIQVNPYEIARLARALGISTSEARARFTKDGVLLQTDDGNCVFLTPEGCGVHADRPLVCRLFPLGRVVLADGSWYYTHLDPGWANGTFGTDGTAGDYVASQGAGPFIEAADAYFHWYVGAARALAESAGDDADGEEEDLLDLDGQLARWAAQTGTPEPDDIDARMRLHVALLSSKIGDSQCQIA